MERNKKTSGRLSDIGPGRQEVPPCLEEFKPKTAFGKELWAMRRKALAEGMRLMTNEEILAEIESRRYGRLTESHD